MKQMRRVVALLAPVAIGAWLSGCDLRAFDNYDPPGSLLTGRVVYQGTPVGVRSNGVQLELWQPGFELNEKIPVHVAQDGSFSAMLFDGDYKLNLLAGNGPWLDSQDTVRINVRGRTEIEVPVTPYYVVDNLAVQRAGDAVTAAFDVGVVQSSRAVEYVGLYLSNTAFVDRTNMVARTEVPGSAIDDLNERLTLSTDLPAALLNGTGVYARVGIKTVGVAEMLFSPVQRVVF